MPVNENEPNQLVRAAIVRSQPQPDKVSHERPQVLAVQRPNWSNFGRLEWQLLGGQFGKGELRSRAIDRVVEDEVGWAGLNYLEVGEYENNGWVSRLYVAHLDDLFAQPMVFDPNRNQGLKWFDTTADGQVQTVEQNEQGLIVAVYTFAFDNGKMLIDALAKTT